MKITIKATPEEVKELLQATENSEEQKNGAKELWISGIKV